MEAKQYAVKQPMDHLRNQRGNQKIETMTMKTQWGKSLACSKSSSKREVYSDTSLPQEIRKI